MSEIFLFWGSVFVAINVGSFLLMFFDKYLSKKEGGKTRISEGALFFIAILFGGIGVYLGMFSFHHKTRHWYFIAGIPLLIFQNIAFLYFLFLFFSDSF
ncbi:MAG: DUF1294 domain-containing protein [Candidatus Moraniibacteriota bacterium]|nr:MAG: DUF1294 domain-containing protein [Candidatus Moranbacteria bacterium]